MNEKEELPQNNILVNLPVNVTYTAIENYLKKTVIGEVIKTEDENGKISRYAQILDISIDASVEEKYDLAVDLKLKTLTTVLKNKEIRILLHAALFFDQPGQQVSVSDYKLKGITGNWLMNNTIEGLANSLLRGKLIQKMRYDLRPLIEEKILELNNKMEDQYELTSGINLFGKIASFSIKKILAKPTNLMVLVDIKAYAVIDIEEIPMGKSDPQNL